MLTDSGGIQEETTYLGVPCFTLRDNTERPVTVRAGTNTVLGLDAGPDRRDPGPARGRSRLARRAAAAVGRPRGRARGRCRCRLVAWRRPWPLPRPPRQAFFDLFVEAGENSAPRCAAAQGDAREVARGRRRAFTRHPQGRAGGRPDHPRHRPAAQLDLRHADRSRGHLRPRDPARRHRRLHRGGGRLPRPLPDRGADGPGARARRRPRQAPASSSAARSRTCAGSRTSSTTGSRSTVSRTMATASPATPSRRCSPTGSTRWS